MVLLLLQSTPSLTSSTSLTQYSPLKHPIPSNNNPNTPNPNNTLSLNSTNSRSSNNNPLNPKLRKQRSSPKPTFIPKQVNATVHNTITYLYILSYRNPKSRLQNQP